MNLREHLIELRDPVQHRIGEHRVELVIEGECPRIRKLHVETASARCGQQRR